MALVGVSEVVVSDETTGPVRSIVTFDVDCISAAGAATPPTVTALVSSLMPTVPSVSAPLGDTVTV